MTDAEELEILQQFVGSAHHAAWLSRIRKRLIEFIAAMLGAAPESPELHEAHRKVRLLLDLLVEERLDTIDLQVLSTQAASQFETALPQRVDYAERVREMRDDASTL